MPDGQITLHQSYFTFISYLFTSVPNLKLLFWPIRIEAGLSKELCVPYISLPTLPEILVSEPVIKLLNKRYQGNDCSSHMSPFQNLIFCLPICLISIASIQYIPKDLLTPEMLRSPQKLVGLMGYFYCSYWLMTMTAWCTFLTFCKLPVEGNILSVYQ